MKLSVGPLKRTPLVKDLVSLTYDDIVRRGLITPFIVFAAFLASFPLLRLAAHTLPSVMIGKYHIHHFYFGIMLLIVSNWVSLATNRERVKHMSAILFGIGLAFVADEVGLLLTCTSPLQGTCDYHARVTWDFFMVIVGVFMSVLYFKPVWRRFRNAIKGTLKFLWARK